jgi:hypothetical protein
MYAGCPKAAKVIHTQVPAKPTQEQSWLGPVASDPAQRTQALEPILFPKLRIYFADFPYLHCSIN